MSLPTLLKPKSILPQKWMTLEQKRKLESMKSIDWIIEYLIDRSWSGTTRPKVKIKTIGSKVGVFRSGTGTGKSTVIPPAIYAEFFEKRGVHRRIICTQPTVATTAEIPTQIVAFNKNLILGENIGFQTGSIVKKPITGILFATVGILLQHLKILTDEEFMRKYAFIIIDEVHIRSIELDTVLLYLKRFLERNYESPDCPYIILTSGTFDPDIYMNYFECPSDSFLDIVGNTFPIAENFAEFDVADYISYATDKAEQIHVEEIKDFTEFYRDILIFVSGIGQIKEIVGRIHKLNAEVFKKGLEYSKEHSARQQLKYKKGGGPEVYYLCPVSLDAESYKKGEIDYQNILANIVNVKTPIYEIQDGELTEKILEYVSASRRVYVATNAIETGLTIDSLKYCIDTGFVNESVFNPNFGTMALVLKAVTRASATQRRGRVGRKAPGVYYACYTKKTIDSLVKAQFPEIIKADSTPMLLDIIISETETTLEEINYKDIDQYDDLFQKNQFDQKWYRLNIPKQFLLQSLVFIQSPSADGLLYSIEKLRVLGFIDENYNPTILGWYASKFRKINVENCRMILAGYHHGANILDLITITCFLQAGYKLGIKRKKYKPRNILGVSEKESEKYYNLLIADEFIEYLFIWHDFMELFDDISDDLKTALKKKKMTKKDVSKLQIIERAEKWCEENNFSYEVMLKIIDARDTLIGDLLNLGLNCFYNGLNLIRGSYDLVKILRNNINEGMEEITKIKKCIYEGYRLNLYIWNDVSKQYVNSTIQHNVSVESKILSPNKLDDAIKQAQPQKIIVSSVAIRPSSNNPGLYEFFGDVISVLDGFVDVDVDFIN